MAAGEGAGLKGVLADITDRGIFSSLKVIVEQSAYIIVHIPSREVKGLNAGGEIFLDCKIPAHPLSEEVNSDG